jgi:translocon-associated protein subunit alpha
LDGETFFLYLFLAAGVVLLLVLGQQALASMGKRRGGGSRYGKMWFCLFFLRH